MNRMNSKAVLVPGIVLVIMVSIGIADGAEMTRWTIDSGGATFSTGGVWELSGTIGQPDAGSMAGGVFNLTGGFWLEVPPCDCNSTGGVDLLDYDDFAACLSGPGASVMGGCECFDVDRSGAVDLQDFAVALTTFTG